MGKTAEGDVLCLSSPDTSMGIRWSRLK